MASSHPTSVGGQFMTTHWSVVLAAGRSESPEAEAALAELCRVYWYPLYAYVRRRGHNAHDAEDLTQGFFAVLLAKKYLSNVTLEGGRFRSFLLTALKRYMANEWDKRQTRKRGGRETILSLDAQTAESRYRLEPTHGLTPEKLFEQQWAETLLGTVLTRLGNEYEAKGKRELFEQLQGSLTQRRAMLRYAEIADLLGMTEPAIKMAVRRIRGRYRELLREEIGKTVNGPDEIESELRHLFKAFTRS